MPAVSQAQANLFRLVNAYKQKALTKKDVSPQVVAMAKDLTKKQISDYMVAKKGAPDKAPMARTGMEGVDTSIEIEGITLTDLQEFLKYLESVGAEQASMPKYMYIN